MWIWTKIIKPFLCVSVELEDENNLTAVSVGIWTSISVVVIFHLSLLSIFQWFNIIQVIDNIMAFRKFSNIYVFVKFAMKNKLFGYFVGIFTKPWTLFNQHIYYYIILQWLKILHGIVRPFLIPLIQNSEEAFESSFLLHIYTCEIYCNCGWLSMSFGP